MEARTRPSSEPGTDGDGAIIEREVETIRTRQHTAGAAVDAIPALDAVVSERTVSYFETLPERLSAVGLVGRTAIESLLGIRFLLHASGANTNSTFVGLVDGVSWPVAGPFANVFSNRAWGPGTIEISTLVAMGVYLITFSLIGRLVTALAPRLSGVASRRGVIVPWSSSLFSTPAPSPEDEERRPRLHLGVGKGDTRRRRRLVRPASARKL